MLGNRLKTQKNVKQVKDTPNLLDLIISKTCFKPFTNSITKLTFSSNKSGPALN